VKASFPVDAAVVPGLAAGVVVADLGAVWVCGGGGGFGGGGAVVLVL
jgi:hypothetical protein